MAEYSRGLDNRDNDRSGHSKSNEKNTRSRMWGVDLDSVNYEQRRPPYGSSKESGAYDNTGPAMGGPGGKRDDV